MSCSVSKDSKGYRIDYRYRGRKSSLRLGSRANKRQCEAFATKMAALIDARSLGSADAPLECSLTQWLAGLADHHYSKLHRIGLCPPRRKSMPMLEYLREYFDSHGLLVEATDGTGANWGRSIRNASLYFGEDKLLQSVTESDAKAFKVWLSKRKGQKSERMAPTTVDKTCCNVSQAFGEALREGLIHANPFDRVPKGRKTNPERQTYVATETVDLLIAQSSDPELRILVALGRYGGLRLPSEANDLRWGDWDKEKNLLAVKSPKTKRYGKPNRLVPVAPKLRSVLEANKPTDADPEDHVLPLLRNHSNARMRLIRAAEEAGLQMWDGCFKSLRASAITDWSERFSLADVANWAGHTPTITAGHYLRARQGKRLESMAREIGGLNDDGTRGGNGADSEVAPMVASSAVTTRPEGASEVQPSACHGIVNAADESCLLVGVAHQQVRTRGNGRRGIRTPVGISQQIYSLPSLAA